MEHTKLLEDKNRNSSDSGISVDGRSSYFKNQNSGDVTSIAKSVSVKNLTNHFESLCQQQNNQINISPSVQFSEISENMAEQSENIIIENEDSDVINQIICETDNNDRVASIADDNSDFEDVVGVHEEDENVQNVNEVINSSVDDENYDSFTDSFDSEDEEVCDSSATHTRIAISQNSGKIMNIMNELLENEEIYVQTLEKGINNYISVMSEPKLPAALRGQKYHIFGNIEKIYEFHKFTVFPKIVENCCSIEGIAETFINLIENDHFYCYILFALNRPKSENICKNNLNFFMKRQSDVGDKLGLNSFLLQPIQRLPRYRLLLNEIIKELLKLNIENFKQEIGLLCKAEIKLQKFIDTVNESMSINDIKACNEINLLHQGKFKKMYELDIYDWEQRRKYHGKIFLFEKCILYTEMISKNSLDYRGHYMSYEIGFYNDGKNKLILFAYKRKQQEIELTAADINDIQNLAIFVETVLKNFGTVEKCKMQLQAFERRSSSTIRSSVFSTFSNRSSSSTTSSRESYDVKDTKWEDEKHIRVLLSSQNHFCQILENNRKYYIDDLPEDLKTKLADFMTVISKLIDIHQNRIYKDLLEKGKSVNRICEIFTKYLKDNLFDIYFDYIKVFKKAAKVLNNIYRGTDKGSSNQNIISPTADDFLFSIVEQIGKYKYFFVETLRHASDAMNKNSPFDIDLFKKIALVEVQINKINRNIRENYKLFNLDEKVNVESMGFIVYSEKVMLDNEVFYGHKLFLTEMGVICVKIEVVKDYDNTIENYLRILFIEKLYGYRYEMKIKDSKKSPKRLNFFIQDTKFAVLFRSKMVKISFYEKYIQCCKLILIKCKK